MTKLQRFIPQTPDPYLKQSDQLGSVKFGHINALVDALNATIFGDYLQLAGDGPMSTTLRALEDPDGNIANLYLATNKTAISGSLKIGNATANTGSAILQIDSTNQGVLFPRMTTLQRDAIVSPAVGLLVYNTTDLVLNGWNGTEWTEVGGGGGLALLDDALMTTTLTQVVDKENTPSILRISTESVGIGTATATGLLNLYKTAATTRFVIDGDAGQSKIITFRTGGLQRFGLYVNNTAESGANVGSDFVLRRYTDGGTLGGTPFFIKRSTGNVGINTITPAATLDVNGTANIAERLTIEADSTATTQSTAVIQNTTLNSGIALVPNGTGAITADIPDGTATGGNARGANAVDLQSSRTTSADRVASGTQSFIGGGLNNQVTVTRGIVVGGENNRVLGGSGSIVGGEGNLINGGASASFIGGGLSNVINTNSSYSTISGGQSNTASTNTHATVVGGQSNVSSGLHSVSGGQGNTASGVKSIALGLNNIASGNDYNVAIGSTNNISGDASIAFGSQNTVSSNLSGAFGESNNCIGTGNRNYIFGFGNALNTNPSNTYLIGVGNFAVASSSSYALGTSNRVLGHFQLATGNDSVAYLRNQNTYGNGRFVNEGSIQISNLIAKRQGNLISDETTVLSLDGTGVTNLIIPPNNYTWNVKVKTVARVISITGTATGVTVGDSFMQDDTLLFKRVGGTSSVVGVNNTNIIADISMGAASMGYSAGASQELALTFKAPFFVGGGSVLINIVSQVELVEVAV